ncbi:hypothetical protein SGRIM128S_09418 [Streptomyces griseomycini]
MDGVQAHERLGEKFGGVPVAAVLGRQEGGEQVVLGGVGRCSALGGAVQEGPGAGGRLGGGGARRYGAHPQADEVVVLGDEVDRLQRVGDGPVAPAGQDRADLALHQRVEDAAEVSEPVAAHGDQQQRLAVVARVGRRWDGVQCVYLGAGAQGGCDAVQAGQGRGVAGAGRVQDECCGHGSSSVRGGGQSRQSMTFFLAAQASARSSSPRRW